MKRTMRLLSLTVLVAAAVTITLFVVQNGERTVDLSLDLGFWAAHLKEPVAVPVLMGITLAAGMVLGALPVASWGMRLRRKLRQPEPKASESAPSTDEWA